MKRKAVTASIIFQDRSSTSASRFLGRSALFSNTVGFTVDDCTLCFADVDVEEPVANAFGVISLTLHRDSWSVEMKSTSSAMVDVVDIRATSEGLLRGTQ